MKIKHILISTLLFIAASCSQDKVYEDEQYKNVFALISGDDNIYSYFFDLRKEESTGYITLSVGGSNNIKEDVIVNLVEDKSHIDNYNKVNYDMDISRFAQALPASKYDIESLQCKIPAGAVKASLPFKIRPEGLSPDSVYFISVHVDTYNRYEVNPEKNYLLYRVRIKNQWALGDGNTLYTLRGYQKQGGGSETMVPGTKVMHPLSKNSVRIMAGTEIYKSEKPVLNKAAIILEVGEDNKVTVKPYRDIEVTQIDGNTDFPNIFKLEDDGYKTYKTFLLCYNYKINGVTYEMKEELRLEYDPKKEEEL